MTDLQQALPEYLTLRRGLGYKLHEVGRLLTSFVAFADQAGACTVSIDLALAWATLPAEAAPVYIAHRLSAVRGFAGYLQTIDPATQIPAAGLLPGRGYQPPTPYLYSDADVLALLAAARALTPPLRSATFETLIGLLAVSGLRIGEVMRLDRDEVNLTDEVLTVRNSKFGRSREVLCHRSTVEALRVYADRRDGLCTAPRSASFFVSTRGARLTHSTIHRTFQLLLRQTGLDQRPGMCRPRVHDFRHSFAVNTLLRWYRDGIDVQARMPLLSTYLGHINPAATYWYLSAAPELMALAAERLERFTGEPS